MSKAIAYSNYSANEALDLIDQQLQRSRTDLSMERIWIYLKLQRNIERSYPDLDEVMPLTTLTILLDKLSRRYA